MTTVEGPVRIPRERYTSEAFAALERERLWPHVWVLGCTVDHVAEPGDLCEVRIGELSVLVVRAPDGELRAFQNACRHRGNQLCEGNAQGLTEIRCRYHRWTWDLTGQLREVPSRTWFDGLRNEDFPLLPVRVDTWARLVFVTLDPHAPPLAEWLEDVPADSAWVGLDDFRCTFVTRTPVEANWKVIADGFSETYHIQGIHRDLLGSMDDIDTPQRIWGRHGVSYQDYAVPSPRLGRDVTDESVWDSFVATQGARMGPEPGAFPGVGDGATVADVVAERIRAHHAGTGVDLSRFDTGTMLRLSQYNLFPNTTVLVTPDLLSVLSARPGPAADRAELVMFHFTRAASADAPRTVPVDVDVAVGAASFGAVLDADVDVLAGMQRGLRQPGLDEIVLSREECRIVNMHRNLERVLGLEPGGRVT